MLALTLILLVPYFAWGIYSLHRRFVLHEEWPFAVEVATIAGLTLFYWATLSVMRTYISDRPALLVFSGICLFASSLALYGHMMIGIASRIIVDAVMISDHTVSTSPRLGPAESLERQKDYEGAYKEYLVLARMYPRDTTVKLRLADNCVLLGRPEEAAEWLDRALLRVASAEDHATVASRLAEIAERRLEDPERARAALRAFLQKHPDTDDARHFADRLERVGRQRAVRTAAPLDSMDEKPIHEDVDDVLPEPVAKTRSVPSIEAIEDAPPVVEPVEEPVAPEPPKKPEAEPAPRESSLSPIDAPLEPPAPQELPRGKRDVPGLERMTDADEESSA